MNRAKHKQPCSWNERDGHGVMPSTELLDTQIVFYTQKCFPREMAQHVHQGPLQKNKSTIFRHRANTHYLGSRGQRKWIDSISCNKYLAGLIAKLEKKKREKWTIPSHIIPSMGPY